MITYNISITNDYISPQGVFATNEDYMTFINNRAAQSYKIQYGTTTTEEGITAAREAYNATQETTNEP